MSVFEMLKSAGSCASPSRPSYKAIVRSGAHHSDEWSEALRGLDLHPLGNFEKLGGPLLTKTLLFIGQGMDTKRLGAYDKETGREVWHMDLPARFHAAPITYMIDGKQYIVLAVGGSGEPERLIALALS